MGNQQSSAQQNIPEISLKIGFDRQLHIWRVIFIVGSIEFDNPFDVIYFHSKPVGLEIIPHLEMREVKKFKIIHEDGSMSCGWIYLDNVNPQSFQVLPVLTTGRRLRNHPTKFYIYDRIDETTTWVITIFEVRDVHGNLEILHPDVERIMFSAGCRITERMIVDTGSTHIPELEYDTDSNEIQQIQLIELRTIYAMMNDYLQSRIIQTSELINQSID